MAGTVLVFAAVEYRLHQGQGYLSSMKTNLMVFDSKSSESECFSMLDICQMQLNSSIIAGCQRGRGGAGKSDGGQLA